MIRSLKTEAIVLRKKDLLNRDVLISFFSQDLGRLTVFAKGVKKITSRRLPHVQTANLINCVLYKKDERFFLQETSLVSGFSQIKNNQEKMQVLYQLFFAVERLLPDHQPETTVYRLVMKFLIELSNSERAEETLLTKYLNKILKALGYFNEDKSFPELIHAIQEIIHEKMPELHL